MLFSLVLLSYNLVGDASALTIPSSSDIDIFSPPKCTDITHCRTIWGIIWSCLATIFACMWVAVHHNVPAPGQRPILIILERVAITVCALLVPEYVVAWAIRQWLVANHIAWKNQELEREREELLLMGEMARETWMELVRKESGPDIGPSEAEPHVMAASQSRVRLSRLELVLDAFRKPFLSRVDGRELSF